MEVTIQELNKIFRDVLDNEDLVITEATTAADVEEWDSLNHIQLIVAIEKHYKIRLTSQEIHSWKQVSNIMESIKSRVKQ